MRNCKLIITLRKDSGIAIFEGENIPLERELWEVIYHEMKNDYTVENEFWFVDMTKMPYQPKMLGHGTKSLDS